MNFHITIVCVILFFANVICQSFGPSALDRWNPLLRNFRGFASRALGRNSENLVNLKRAKAKNKLQPQLPLSYPFPCNVSGFRSAKPPTNVHKVRPGDIDIIAALGDSLTAGTGLVALDLVSLYTENRGISWSIGGQGTWREFVTLPNILKEFNPNLFGYSLRDSTTLQRESQFNPAEPAAISSELPYMTNILIKRIKSDSRVNLKQHWKLITIMIGANNFCLDICYYSNMEEYFTNYTENLLTVLRLIRDNLPRTIVNIVSTPDTNMVNEMNNLPDQCALLHQLECYCFFSQNFKSKRDSYHKILRKWQKFDEEITRMPEFQQNDFAAVFQPFVINFTIPTTKDHVTDYSFFSYDCFHMSQKLNAQVANSLWNNMLEPVGKKSDDLSPLFEFVCPTEENPYIFTNVNSR